MQINFPNMHPRQREIASHPARFRVCAAGRRFGKSRLGSALCVADGLRGKTAWWVAPSYPVARVGWKMIKRLASQIPGVEIRQGDYEVNFQSGGSVRVRSADNPDSLRGEGLDLVVMDECAFVREEAWTEALRPALSDRLGRAMFISTPKGRGWFYRLWLRGLGDDPHWKSWQLPTTDNPYIDPAEVEAAREVLPELTFEQEYLAVFLEGQGAVFRNLDACLIAPTADPNQHPRHRIVIGCDWGKQADWTSISVGCVTCGVEVDRDRFNKIDYAYQLERLRTIADRWRPVAILPERNSMGEPLTEQLIRMGLPIISGPDGKAGFSTTAQSKTPLIENMALTIERAEWALQDDPVWRGELEAYERQVSPVTGRSQYSAPDGMHDDTVIARALMLWAGRHSSPMPDAQPIQRSKWTQPTADDGGSKWRRY